MRSMIVAAVLAVSAVPTVASAAVVDISGSLTVTDPTFSSPNYGAPPTGTIGPGYYYDSYTFTVSASGLYSGEVTSAFDNVLGLYAASFNPATPLVNAIVYNDDARGSLNAYFQQNLLAGQTYVAVVTSYSPGALGAYRLQFDGVGVVQPPAVPEPATWAMMIGGFGLVGGALRSVRKRTLVSA